MKAIREAVPDVTKDPVMKKIILFDDAEKISKIKGMGVTVVNSLDELREVVE